MHEKVTYTCKHCGKNFNFSSNLCVHVKKYHTSEGIKRGEKVQCNLCARYFSKSTLQAHKKSVHENVTYSCEMCGKQFNYSPNLYSHIKKYHSELYNNSNQVEIIPCEICSKPYKKYELATHKRAVHELQKLKCYFCDKDFSYKSNLHNHIKNYHIKDDLEPLLIKCEFCHKSYSKIGLYVHLKNTHYQSNVTIKTEDITIKTEDVPIITT